MVACDGATHHGRLIGARNQVEMSTMTDVNFADGHFARSQTSAANVCNGSKQTLNFSPWTASSPCD